MVELAHNEAEALKNHLEWYIIQEVKDNGQDYDSIDYLLTLCHVFEKCRKEVGDNTQN